MFDPKCYDLAKFFLADHPNLNKEIFWEELAQDIQDEIEQSIETMELFRAAAIILAEEQEQNAKAKNKV